jgi:3',5'-cyclic AMP phosphodiesterase CpdA
LYTDREMTVLGLNTARRLTRKNGRVSFEQIDEIRRVFSATPVQHSKILVTHHPLGEPIAGEGLELAGRYRPTLVAIADAGVHVLLSGHHHRAASGAVAIGIDSAHSILIVHAGTAISTRTRGSEGNTYNRVQLEPDRVSSTVMAWSPDEGFRESRTWVYSRREAVWREVG